MTRRWGPGVWALVLSVGAVCACVAVVVACAAVASLSEPLRFHGYRAVPPTVCPGEPVNLATDWALAPFPGVTDIRVTSQWVSRDSEGSEGQRVSFGGTVGTVPAVPHPRGENVSPVQRETPVAPGRWKLETEITYTKRVLFVSHTETLPVTSGSILEVRDC